MCLFFPWFSNTEMTSTDITLFIMHCGALSQSKITAVRASTLHFDNPAVQCGSLATPIVTFTGHPQIATEVEPPHRQSKYRRVRTDLKTRLCVIPDITAKHTYYTHLVGLSIHGIISDNIYIHN